MKTFLTFGNKSYHKQVERISLEAKEIGIFDRIISLTEKEVLNDSNLCQDNRDFILDGKNGRGFGYWLWKPYIIMNTLGKMNENDFLIYVDSGCTINANGRQRILEYLEILNCNKYEYGILSFQLNHLPEIRYTKRALFTYLNTDNYDMMSGQCMATVIIMKKNVHSLQIVNEWYRIASIGNLINDDKGCDEEYNTFIDHRHDQSIFSLLVKKYGSIKIADETYFSPDWTRGEKFPFWATRIRYQ
jgi:hypothetical protein